MTYSGTRIDYQQFIAHNLDFLISYKDNKSNTRLVKYRDFVINFREDLALNGLLESVIENPMSPYFAFSFFSRMYDCNKINNIEDATYNGIDGNFLFCNNVIMSALDYINTSVYTNPIEYTDALRNAKDEANKSYKKGCLYIVVGLILIVALSEYFFDTFSNFFGFY